MYSFREKNLSLVAKLRHYLTAQKMKFSVKDFFSMCNQIRRKQPKHQPFIKNKA